MAITAADVNKLRQETGAGMMDCKNALVEANGDFEQAIDILRKKGQKVAAKRADRASNEGRAIAKVNADHTFGAVIVVSCETDFVGKNSDFVAFAEKILDNAMAANVKTRDELMELSIEGRKVSELLLDMTGKTGEKIELPAYNTIEAPCVAYYNHNGNRLATIAGFNIAGDNVAEAGHHIAMQIAAMNPMAVDGNSIAQDVKDHELAIAKEKTVAELIQKAVEVELKKAGINPNLVDSDDHIASNITKGWLTEEEANKAREIKVSAAEEKAKTIQENMVNNIAQGRLNKFIKENTLMGQEYIMDSKMTVADFMKQIDSKLVCTGFYRLQLGA